MSYSYSHVPAFFSSTCANYSFVVYTVVNPMVFWLSCMTVRANIRLYYLYYKMFCISTASPPLFLPMYVFLTALYHLWPDFSSLTAVTYDVCQDPCSGLSPRPPTRSCHLPNGCSVSQPFTPVAALHPDWSPFAPYCARTLVLYCLTP